MIQHTIRNTAAMVLEPVLPYTSYRLEKQEYIGTVDDSLASVIDTLNECGYHYQMLSARKEHPSEDVWDSGSFARIPDEHPAIVDGTALAAREPGECQYHIQLFEVDGSVEVYSHYEIHPYPWTPHWSLSRSQRHYSPTRNDETDDVSMWTYIEGVVDDRVVSAFGF